MSYDLLATAKVFFTITPSDTVDIPRGVKSVYVGGAGDIVAVDAEGNEVPFTNHPVGYMGVRPVRIKATGTTATGLVGLV